MPFRLTDAPSTFQSLMNAVFKPYIRRFVLIFFDDILVYSKTKDEHLLHLKHLKTVLTITRENQLYAKGSKCQFVVPSIEYLGHVISAKGAK